MKKKLKWALIGLVAVAALLQLTNPARTNPPIVPEHELFAPNTPPPPVAAILHAACFDCHSYETKWPWYSRVAPVSWLVVRDVNGGRERMNFSDWPNDHPDRAVKRLGYISDEVHAGDMPPAKYTAMHPEARLTQAQRDQIVQWANAAAERLNPASGAAK